MKKNLQTLQIKAIASLDGKVIRGTLSSIDESLGGSYRTKQWQERWRLDEVKPDSWDVNLSFTYIGKLYLGPIHLADLDSTRSTLIYLRMLLIHL